MGENVTEGLNYLDSIHFSLTTSSAQTHNNHVCENTRCDWKSRGNRNGSMENSDKEVKREVSMDFKIVLIAVLKEWNQREDFGRKTSNF